jgi:hypothetical protein
MDSWHSYPSIFNVGHREVATLLDDPVYVEEKVDGSQFSFGIDQNGDLRVRSKGAVMYADAPEPMFKRAVGTVKEITPLLHPGWTYRAEYLQKPKHNSLSYDRIPKKHLMVFDVNTAEADYLPYAEKHAEAARLGLECVPLVFEGKIDNLEQFRSFLDRESVLGGQKIEGVVVKPMGYDKFGRDKKCLMAKFVSENFKEVHSKEWKTSNPGHADVIDLISAQLTTAARWNKSIQHMREGGKLESSPRDIGALLSEIQKDVEKECADEIKERLFKWAWPVIRRRVCAGFPEYYKEQLLKAQFDAPSPPGEDSPIHAR